MSAFFAAISDTGGGSASSATTAATAAAGAGPNVYARAVARGESLLSTEDHSSAGGEGARVVSPVNGVTAGPDNSFSVGAAVTGEGDSVVVATSGGGVREDQDIPSQHICPLVQEPPFDAVHFDVPSANGTTTTPTSQQVYEKK